MKIQSPISDDNQFVYTEEASSPASLCGAPAEKSLCKHWRMLKWPPSSLTQQNLRKTRTLSVKVTWKKTWKCSYLLHVSWGCLRSPWRTVWGHCSSSQSCRRGWCLGTRQSQTSWAKERAVCITRSVRGVKTDIWGKLQAVKRVSKCPGVGFTGATVTHHASITLRPFSSLCSCGVWSPRSLWTLFLLLGSKNHLDLQGKSMFTWLKDDQVS